MADLRSHMKHDKLGRFEATGRNCLYCDEPVASIGLCPMHWYRWYRKRPMEVKKDALPNPKKGLVIIPKEIRFWAKVNKTKHCWEWIGGYGSHGYGMLGPQTAHRVSWELHFGPIKSRQMHVCHKCDNKKCVNPDHLFLGTSKENTDDYWNKKKRGVYGQIDR